MKVIETSPEKFRENYFSVYNVDYTEPTQSDLDRWENLMVSEMITVGLVAIGVKNGGLFGPEIMTPSAIRKFREMGYFVRKTKLKPWYTGVFLSREDPKISNWKGDVTIGKFLSYLTPADLMEVNSTFDHKRYGLRLEIKFRYRGRVGKTSSMEQIVVDKTKKEIKEYIQPFVEGIKSLSTPELEILKVSIKIDTIDYILKY